MNPTIPTAVDPDTAAQRAHVLLESEINARLDAVRELARRMNALEDALADYESAWQLATRTGWTEGTLRDIGLRSPETLPERTPRRAAEPAAVDAGRAAEPAAPVVEAAPVVAAPGLAPVLPFGGAAAPVAPAVVTTPAFHAGH